VACSTNEVLTAACKCMKVGIVTHPDKIYMNLTNIHRNTVSHLLCHIMFSLSGE